MKKYRSPFEIAFIEKWKKKEKFVEMAKIGNLPKHQHISIYVNDKGEEREEPHFHLKFSNDEVIRIKFKDLSGMDKSELDSVIKKEFKNWLLSPSKFNDKITNIEACLLTWNMQEHNKRIIKIKDLKWI
jgi:hypothetical protein